MKVTFSLALGAFLGTVAFWLLLTTILPHLPASVLGTAGSVLIADEVAAEATTSAAAIQILQQRGLGISADGYLGRLTDFYSTVLQVALAAFVLFGVATYLSIRWQSIQAAEDMISQRMASESFSRTLQTRAQEAFDIGAEPLEKQIQQLGDVANRLQLVESRIAALSSDEEPPEKPVPQARKRSNPSAAPAQRRRPKGE